MAKKLEGRWFGDSIENFRDEHVAAATGWAKGTSMEFSGSTVRVTIPTEEPRVGRYSVTGAHGTDVFLTVTSKEAPASKVHFKMDDENSLRWLLAGGRAVVMRREH
ncbi:MAG: hypothetical protein SFV15_23955 [Polyangiaceae bacterium]|nr:hypothetical protein [Polyangiaceae bacterium]